MITFDINLWWQAGVVTNDVTSGLSDRRRVRNVAVVNLHVPRPFRLPIDGWNLGGPVSSNQRERKGANREGEAHFRPTRTDTLKLPSR